MLTTALVIKDTSEFFFFPWLGKFIHPIGDYFKSILTGIPFCFKHVPFGYVYLRASIPQAKVYFFK